MKSSDRSKLKAEAAMVNEAVKDILTNDITELNSLLYAAVYVVTKRMGMMKEKREKNEEPFWEGRIKRSIENWRKDLSKIEEGYQRCTTSHTPCPDRVDK